MRRGETPRDSHVDRGTFYPLVYVQHYVFGENSDILAIAKDCIDFFDWDTLGLLDERYLCEAAQDLALGH